VPGAELFTREYEMEQDNVKRIEGSPRPSDIFEPHMPGVVVPPDLDALFRTAREQLRVEELNPKTGTKGQRVVAIVTPERQITFELSPPRGSLPDVAVKQMSLLLPPEPPLDISVVSYTLTEALAQDETRTECIPFLGHLAGFGYLGHSVVVFEGHPTAFESGVRDTDLLIVDSGMLPFIQSDWGAVAFRVMRPGAQVFVHSRESFCMLPVARSGKPQGWQYSEHDGEASYTNCLLTTLAKAGGAAHVTPGRPLPDLAGIATDPDELDWIAGLPFKYDKLNADLVIELLKRVAGWGWVHNTVTKSKSFHTRLIVGEESRFVNFTLSLSKDEAGRKRFTVESR
jgi:hypothetical protein